MGIISMVEEVNSLIKDKDVKYILFDEFEPDEDDICADIIESINRLVHLIFIIFYSMYLKANIEKKEPVIKNQRVIKNFEKVFKTQKINIDFMIFIITELQIQSSSFMNNDYIGYINNNFSYQYWKSKIKKSMLTSRIDLSEEALLQSLILTLESTPLLRHLTIEKNIENKNTIFKINNVAMGSFDINSYQMFYFDESCCEYFIINHIENNSGSHMPIYKVLGKEAFFTRPLKPKKSSFSETLVNYLYRNNNLEKQDALLMNKLYGDNFDRIRILALSISDILKDNYSIQVKLRNKFLDDIEFTHQIGLDNISSHPESHNWDNIITILLIEIGPSELLYSILDDTEFIFKMILKNISIRINDLDRLSFFMDRYKSERKKIDNRIYNDHFSLSQRREEWLIDYEKMLMVKTIINFTSQNSDDQFPNLVESLPVRLKHYKEIVNSRKNYITKVMETNYLFENAFMFLLVFYKGLIAYSLKNMELRKSKSLDNNLENDSKSETQSFQEQCEEAFLKASKEKIDDLNRKKPSLGILISQFRDLEKSTYIEKNHRVSILPNGNALEHVIGRYNICDMNKLNSILNGTKTKLSFTNIINIAKHGDAATGTKKVTRNDFKNFFERGMDLWILLMKNEELNNNQYFSNSISFTPIFPYVIQFTMNKRQKDGYSVDCYSMKSVDSDITDIKFLSSKQHSQHENYYCIPNASSSTDMWWIEPFYIRCDKVDELFLNLEEHN